MKISDRIIKAKVQLNDELPFFAYLVLHLNKGKEITQNKKIPSAGINYRGYMEYNPTWMDKLTDEEIRAVITHEVMHLSTGTLFRAGNRVPEIFNYATDIVINNILVHNGFKLPKQTIIPVNDEVTLFDKIHIKDIDKKFAESIYDELYKKLKDNGMLKEVMVCGYGIPKGKEEGKYPSFDSHEYGSGGTDKEKKEVEKFAEAWGEKLVEGLNHAKNKGKVPKGMQRIVDKVLNKKLNWRSLLYKYMSNSLIFDNTWSYPSKKSFSTGYYMPSPVKENIDVVVSVDTSGSIDQKELTNFISEIVSIGNSFANITITIVVVDAAIHEVYTLSNGNIQQILNLRVSGGGGTDHTVFGDWVVKNKPDARCIINLTDGYTSFYKDGLLRGDTIWVISENGCDPKDVPFGRVIKMED